MATHCSIFAWRIPMDRGAWRATVHGVRKSQTGLTSMKHLTMHTHTNTHTHTHTHIHIYTYKIFLLAPGSSLFPSLPRATSWVLGPSTIPPGRPKTPITDSFGIFLSLQLCLQHSTLHIPALVVIDSVANSKFTLQMNARGLEIV